MKSPLRMTVGEFEKIKCDAIYDEILSFKHLRGELPSYIILETSYIPEECKKEMVIEVDNIKIPIIESGGKPC